MRKVELSKNNPYYISKERYYELKHFCFQYNEWKKALAMLNDGTAQHDILLAGIAKSNYPLSRTEQIAIARSSYSKRIELIDKCIKEAQPAIAPYLLRGVTEQIAYDILRTQNCPCCREYYYNEYRKFFWRLSAERD